HQRFPTPAAAEDQSGDAWLCREVRKQDWFRFGFLFCSPFDLAFSHQHLDIGIPSFDAVRLWLLAKVRVKACLQALCVLAEPPRRKGCVVALLANTTAQVDDIAVLEYVRNRAVLHQEGDDFLPDTAGVLHLAAYPVRCVGSSGDDDDERVAFRDAIFDLRPDL